MQEGRTYHSKTYTGDIASQVWKHVVADVNNGDDRLQPMLWKHYLIINVIDTDAPSQRTHSPEAMLQSGAKEKERVYEQAAVELSCNFTPIVLSVDGLIHREVEHFLKRIYCSCQPCSQMGKLYSQMCVYVRARLCLCYHKGNQYAYGLGMDDGAPLYSIL